MFDPFLESSLDDIYDDYFGIWEGGTTCGAGAWLGMRFFALDSFFTFLGLRIGVGDTYTRTVV